MAQKTPIKTILLTSLPAIIDLSSQTIMFAIEAMFIGRIGYAALAGQGIAIQMVLVFLMVLITFILGSSLIISRHLGAGEIRAANHVFGQALMIGIVLSFIFALCWYFGGIYLFEYIGKGTNSAAQLAGISYLKIVALFAPIILTNFIAVGIIRGAGDTHISMIINLTINCLNLILAPLLIFGWFGFPRWEVEGAAIALGASHSIGFVLTLYILRTRKSVLFLSFVEVIKPNYKTFKKLIRTGVPTTMEQLVWNLGVFIVSLFALRVSEQVAAAHVILYRIQNILSMVYTGLGIAAMTLMGKNIGASNFKLAERTARNFSLVGFFLSLSITVAMIVYAEQIMRIFTTDREVIILGARVMFVFALVQIPKAVDGVVIGNLRGAGDLKWIMWMTIIGVVFFEIGFNWWVIFILNFGLLGIWSIHFIDECLRLVANYWRFKGGRWKFIDL